MPITSILPLVLGRWGMGFIGVILLALTLWNYGPLWPPLSSPYARIAVVIILLLVWAGPNLWIDRRRRKREKALTEGVTANGADPKTDTAAEEVAAQREKLTRAMDLLRRASNSRGYLYEQPWYVIIGPPGAGKTTALVNSGLRFPLAEELGQGAVAGVGGTRSCDWWFTDSAVLIDTAGRYTTQDSDAVVDRAGWEGFLDLLRRTRPREPLNGVIVALSLADVAGASRDERLAHARAIRRRLKEIETRLNLRVPVYAILTKADLLAGFIEFFDDLDTETRGQVWGTTFGAQQSGSARTPSSGLRRIWDTIRTGWRSSTLRKPDAIAEPRAAFASEFNLLLERLNGRVLTRLQAERSPDRRALLAGFPAQFASLQQPIQEFLDEAFGGSRLDPAPFLRGVYFSSGTQEGTPIDRLTGLLARNFGISQRQASALKPVQGRSYFLSRLLREVVFGEAMLVSHDPRATRQRWLLRGAGYAAVVVVVLVMGGEMLHARAANEAAINRTAQALDAYDRAAAALPLDPVTDGDLVRVVPLLDQARALTAESRISGSGIMAVGGLSQRSKLAVATTTVYRNALHNILLPRLIWRLEAQMRGNLNRPDFLFEATQVYLMLGSAGPLDTDLVRSWMRLDWQQTYPGPARQPLREDLSRHLDALLGEPLPKMNLDGALVAAARTTFSRVPLAQRVYSRIQAMAMGQANQQPGHTTTSASAWTPAQVLGPAGERLFVRASGKSLSDGIPGFYTRQGFYQMLLPGLGSVSRDVADESWVLGATETIAPDSPQMAALENQVIAAYEVDYEHQWETMLSDLNVIGFRTLAEASQDLFILGAPASPMRALLNSVADELTLTVPPPSPAAPGAGSTTSGNATSSKHAQNTEAELLSVLGTAPGGTAVILPGQAVNDHFSSLRSLVAGGASAPIETVLGLLNQVQQQLGQMAATAPGTEPPPPTGSDPSQLLQAEAASLPQPVGRWLATIASDAAALRAGGARQEIVSAYDASTGPRQLCGRAIDGHYPFNADATEETPLEDFARLFAPGGLLDGFFNTKLRPYVDTTRQPWQARSVDGVSPPISSAGLAEFERAAAIRDAFFGAGGTMPQAVFVITPQSLDDNTRQVTLTLGNATVSYAHGPANATQITWPGAGGTNQASLAFAPASAGGTLQASGPWAMLRLFDQGSLQPGESSSRYLLSFDRSDRRASFTIEAGSVTSPFSPGLLRGFRCPTLQ
jgi:type VI secretion system protein ImpL